ncbi:3D domain-containing protein [Bdellovibrio sp. NC01]|uniref:3D domain-containing protein n=1 Tax=Bdellovibrio sp. NC01 TaxID=2220073 RepID=UPI00115B850E|nr:3D domain-containing protein [Bdellovibrio sp. NC01]QDK36171.1 hypothetical protein DOE51_00405 [Bdellovibrio sp. NC01]
MKALKNTCKISAFLSFALLAGCGNISSSITTNGSLQAKQQQQTQDSVQTIPLHDMGGSTDEAMTEYFVEETVDSTPQSPVQLPAQNDDDTEAKTPGLGETPQKNPAPQPQQPAPAEDDTKPATPSVTLPKPTNDDIAEAGKTKPTVYYFPVFNEDKNGCDKDEVKTLHGVSGEKIINVCPTTLLSCGIQGSCAIIQKGVRRSFNISDRVSGQDRYFEMTNKECPFGYGVRSSCLDPFFTVAADLDVYKPGDVIFIPSIVGLKLPDGTVHNGYFIVRDQGRGINGKGRFDFYSGFLNWKDTKNPFRKVKFEDVKTSVTYWKVIGDKAEAVRKSRAYPKIPMPPLKQSN